MIPRTFSANTSDLDFASALDVAARIKAKQVSSTELTHRMLARIDRYNPKLNAFTYQMRDQALAQARHADAALSRGDQVGPFHGVPICVKESFGVKGEPDIWGIVALKGSKAPANSAAVERLLDSGAVLLGGTNVPLAVGSDRDIDRLPGDGCADRPKFVRLAGWNPDHGAILGRCDVY
jgi:Asp-tRNA(Asn)/Glu-tRNA(Gln) amidotransferase A subunit family amidase